MKAILALLIIYIGTFFLVIQGVSQNSAQAAPAQSSEVTAPKDSMDAAKEADTRSLMELLGMRDSLQESATKSSEQFREALLSSVPDNDRGQAFVNAFLDAYQKRFNPDDITSELVAVYDKHFSEEEIKGLLQFYGSPLGQKYAAEMPKVYAEVNAAGRAVSFRVAREVIQDLRKQYPGIGAQARLQKQRAAPQVPSMSQAQRQAAPGGTQP